MEVVGVVFIAPNHFLVVAPFLPTADGPRPWSPLRRSQTRIKASEHDDLFYRGSVPKNLVPVEEVTKTGSISTLSLSQTVT
jgi:hypothetical protein